ncbi:MAG: ketopantoate reductase family protein [Dehalococcoidia bacterium]
MRYIVYGAGAIGGRLFAAGHDVVLICRGSHLEAIRRDGLLLRAADGDLRLRIPAVSHPREIAFTRYDTVILTMKTQDSEAALADLEAVAGADMPIICMQNGVENERLAARRFARVYAMLAVLPATFLEPGVVEARAHPITGVPHAGCYPRGVDGLIARVCADLSGARFHSEPDPAVMRLKYAKLLTNLGNAIQLITNAGWTDAAMLELRQEAAREAVACYRAAGIDFASEEEFAERATRFRTGGDPGRTVGSTVQSVLRGHTTIETDYLNGEIVLLGRLHGVPTPLNSTVRRVAVQLAAAGEPPGRFTPTELRALIAAGPAPPGAVTAG